MQTNGAIKQFTAVEPAERLFPELDFLPAPDLTLPFDIELEGVFGSFWFSVGFIQILLALRVGATLLGITQTPFVWFLYGITGPVVSPLRDLLGAPPPLAGATFDTAAVATMAVVAVFAWCVTYRYLKASMPRAESSAPAAGLLALRAESVTAD